MTAILITIVMLIPGCYYFWLWCWREKRRDRAAEDMNARYPGVGRSTKSNDDISVARPVSSLPAKTAF